MDFPLPHFCHLQVAQALRHRTSRRVALGRLRKPTADALLGTNLMSRLVKPASLALHRYCAAKRFFVEGQPGPLSRATLLEGRGALGLFAKDMAAIATAMANAVVKQVGTSVILVRHYSLTLIFLQDILLSSNTLAIINPPTLLFPII